MPLRSLPRQTSSDRLLGIPDTFTNPVSYRSLPGTRHTCYHEGATRCVGAVQLELNVTLTNASNPKGYAAAGFGIPALARSAHCLAFIGSVRVSKVLPPDAK